MKLILQPSAYNAQKKALFDTYYSKLNDMQREAICTVKGPLLVLAGAGSGKTTVLVQRIVHILRYGLACEPVTEPREVPDDFADACGAAAAGERAALGDYLTCFAAGVCPPWAVLAITFTNKAAREIKERLAKAPRRRDGGGRCVGGNFPLGLHTHSSQPYRAARLQVRLFHL